MASSDVLRCTESEVLAIFKTCGRSRESIQQDVENIKKWVEKQPHLPEIPDNKTIESFLSITKFRVEQTKRALDMYYTVRSLIPEFFEMNPNGAATKKLMQSMYYLPLPQLTKDLHRVFVVSIKCPKADFDANSCAAHIQNVAEVVLKEEHAFNYVIIYDATNVRIHHLTKFTPTILKKVVFVMEKVFSNGPKSVHLINAPSFAESFAKLAKSFLKPKLAERVFVHKSMESLYDLVPKAILPEDYGGEEKSMEKLEDAWKRKFLENEPLFERLRGLKVDEKMRPGEPLGSDLFGSEGTFRKLDLD